MSTKASTSDSSGIEVSEQTRCEEAVESILDELPERFEEFSHIHDGNNEYLILTPTHSNINSSGDMSSRLLRGCERKTVLEHGFSFSMITQSRDGFGVKIWFKYEGDSDE